MDLKQHFTTPPENPRSILKIVITISVVLLVMWLFLVSRMQYGETTSEPQNPVVEQRADSLRTLLQREKATNTNAAAPESTDIFSNAFTTFLVLIVLLGGVWLWVRKKMPDEASNKEHRYIRDHSLGQGAQLKIMEINNEIWVLGITSGSVNLLHRYDKDQWSESPADVKKTEKSFYQLFNSKS